MSRDLVGQGIIPANIYFFKVNNGKARTIYEICSKLSIKTLERCH